MAEEASPTRSRRHHPLRPASAAKVSAILLRDDDGYELPSNYVRSCIAEHEQNNDFDEWTVLIDLVRDSWLESFKEDPDRAGAVASAWWASKHHLFKRLALFAAGYPTAIAPSTTLNWLLSQEGKWLWGYEARTEVMPWLATAAGQLDEDDAATLQRKILEGPPEILTEGHPNPTAIKEHFEEIELLALLNLTAGGAKLLPDVQARRDQLQTAYPDVHLSENHRENFSSWTTSGFGNMSALREHITLPQALPELVEALRSDSPDDFWHTDDWRTICRENFRLASDALLMLAKEGTWPRGRWTTALYEWANPEPNSESWNVAGSAVGMCQ